jgi:AcrR family transcriptional regulator
VIDLDVLAVAATDPDRVTAQILDAALWQFETFGLRKSTVEDVTRRSGLSRMTVYRRFGSKQALFSAVIMRELRRGLTAIEAALDPLDSFEDRLVEGFAVALDLGRNHPLLQRLLRTEPELVLPFVTVAGGPGLLLLRDHLARVLQHQRRKNRSGPRLHDPQVVAELLVRLGQSLLLTPESSIDLGSPAAVRRFARTHLLPMVFARSG